MKCVFFPYYCFFNCEEIVKQTSNFDSTSKKLLTSGDFFSYNFFILVSESNSSNRSFVNVHKIFKFKYLVYMLVFDVNVVFNS